MENPIKMDDLGVPLFLETSISVLHTSQMDFVKSQQRELEHDLAVLKAGLLSAKLDG